MKYTEWCTIDGMEEAKAYLSTLSGENARAEFAERIGTTWGHLRNSMYGLRRLSPETCVRFEVESGGAVTRRHLRPEDWHRIWPELVTDEHPAPEERAA